MLNKKEDVVVQGKAVPEFLRELILQMQMPAPAESFSQLMDYLEISVEESSQAVLLNNVFQVIALEDATLLIPTGPFSEFDLLVVKNLRKNSEIRTSYLEFTGHGLQVIEEVTIPKFIDYCLQRGMDMD